MAIVQEVDDKGPGDPFYRTVGLITLEDIIETILQTDIHDEHDAAEVNKEAKTTDERNRLALHLGRLLPTAILGPQEVQAVFYHLTNTVDVLRPASNGHERPISDAGIKRVIAQSPVIDVIVHQHGKSSISLIHFSLLKVMFLFLTFVCSDSCGSCTR
jgi:hypothetical protein